MARALGRGVGRRARDLVRVRGRPVLPRAGRAGQPDQVAAALATLFWLIEGIVRTAIFLGYLVLLSRLRELRRVFEYHGAEHKTIACYEAGGS